MKFISLSISTLVVFFVLVGSAFASNMSFLNNTPLYYFQDSDAKLMVDNANNALEHGKDLKKYNWKDPQTGAWGYAVPSNTRRINGKPCRDLLMFNSARSVTGMTKYTFCKVNGDWKYSES